MSLLSRRVLLTTSASVLAAPAIVGAQSRRQVKLSIGRQPWAAGNSPVTQHMIDAKSFEQMAASSADPR